MKVKLLMVGSTLTGLLVVLSQLTFGDSESLPPVPVTAAVQVQAPAVPIPVVAPTPVVPVAHIQQSSLPVALSVAQAASAEAGEEIELSTQPDLDGVDVSTDEGGQDLITISLDNAPLADVVRMFSRISGANIVAGTNLQGSVTVSMHDVPWEPALSAILDSVNLVLVEKTSGIFTIISKSDLAAEPVAMETIFLNYTSVSNVLPVVQRMLIATNASASAFPSANAIVIQETSSRLSSIRSTVKKIDQPRPQVYIEAKFIELNETAIENLGINWQVLQGYSLGITPGYSYENERVRSDTFTDQLEFSDSRNSQTRQTFTRQSTDTSNSDNQNQRNNILYDSEGVINTSDGSFSVDLTGRNAIPSITREEDEDTGAVTITTDLQDIRPIRGTENRNTRTIDSVRGTDKITDIFDVATEGFSRVQDTVNTETATKLLSAVLSADELAVTLSALKEQDGVEVVSNPKVIVSNGETATIHVGRNEPNVTAVPQGDTGDRFAVALDEENPYIEIGVKLKVTPTVNTEDNITVKIEPELSRKLGDLEVGSVGVSYPITSIRKINTEFQLNSGRTVAIGGLTETSDQESINKVPVLGDIPVIGKYLFQHKSTTKVQDEVVIFVTVGLANPKNLVEVSGIPSEGTLIHRHLANKAAQELAEMGE